MSETELPKQTQVKNLTSSVSSSSPTENSNKHLSKSEMGVMVSRIEKVTKNE